MPLSEWWRERERERLHCLDVPAAATLVFPVLQRENRNPGAVLERTYLFAQASRMTATRKLRDVSDATRLSGQQALHSRVWRHRY